MMWPVPVEPPVPFVTVVDDVATIQNAEVVWCDPAPEAVLTGWTVWTDGSMAVGMVPDQPVVLDLAHGTTYTIRAMSPLGPAGEPREFYETTAAVQARTRAQAVLAAWNDLLSAYLQWRDLRVTPEEHAEAMNGGGG